MHLFCSSFRGFTVCSLTSLRMPEHKPLFIVVLYYTNQVILKLPGSGTERSRGGESISSSIVCSSSGILSI